MLRLVKGTLEEALKMQDCVKLRESSQKLVSFVGTCLHHTMHSGPIPVLELDYMFIPSPVVCGLSISITALVT